MFGFLRKTNPVNPIGLVIMLLGAALVVLAGKLTAKQPEERRETRKLAVKLIGLVICMAGFIMTLLLKA